MDSRREIPTFTPLEWRFLAGACEALAAKERRRATEVGGQDGGDFIISAQGYEQLAKRCMRFAQS